MYNWLKRRKYRHGPEDTGSTTNKKHHPSIEAIIFFIVVMLISIGIIVWTIIVPRKVDKRLEQAIETTGETAIIVSSPEPPIETEPSMTTLVESWSETETTTTAPETTVEPETTAIDIYVEPETTVVAETTSVAIDDNSDLEDDNVLGYFRITGYCYECNGRYGSKSASGMPLVAGQTCAMNRGDMADYSINYGDWIEVSTYGCVQVVDCGCSSGTIDIFVGEHGYAENSITGWSVVSK